jgi:hypothetical protein
MLLPLRLAGTVDVGAEGVLGFELEEECEPDFERGCDADVDPAPVAGVDAAPAAEGVGAEAVDDPGRKETDATRVLPLGADVGAPAVELGASAPAGAAPQPEAAAVRRAISEACSSNDSRWAPTWRMRAVDDALWGGPPMPARSASRCCDWGARALRQPRS